MDNAHRLLSSPAAKAFDLSLEPLERTRRYFPGYQPGMRFDAPRDRFGGKYEEGMIGRFGLGCLLARRCAKSARASSKSPPSTFRSSTGTPTRTATPGWWA
jgi:hypothetical protein